MKQKGKKKDHNKKNKERQGLQDEAIWLLYKRDVQKQCVFFFAHRRLREDPEAVIIVL